MAEFVLIYGKSGSGKSRSLCNFGKDEIFYVNVTGKRPPFRKKFDFEFRSADVEMIKRGLAKMPCKIAVIDDATYIMTKRFMDGHSKPKSGSSSFDLYNDIADEFFGLITYIKSLPDDEIVYVIMHEEANDYGDVKLRTIGKLLDQKVCLEGLATIVLRCVTQDKEHYFLTHTDGSDITKSPEGMFIDDRIPNDLAAVTAQIRAYYSEDADNNEQGDNEQ